MSFRTNAGRGSNGHGVALFSGALVAESANATNLQVTTQPGLSGTTPYTLSPQPVVAAKKSLGTTDTAYVTNVVASLNVLSGSPVLSGTTTKTPVSGVATFTDLVVTGAGTWTITFTSGTLASAVSSTGTTTATANSAPAQPTLSAGTPTSSGVTLTGSAFSDSDVGDTHAASQWQVTTSADTGYATPVISTGDDATNKTSYAATGLSASTDYIARVRYKDSAGNYSLWATSASFTTAAGGFPAFAAGFNFRNTLAWATDQTNEVFVGGESYPHTYTLVGGATVVAGFTSSNSTLQPRDRATSGGVDRRLNGVIFDSTNAPVFRVDVSAAGTYTVHLALGDADNPQTVSGTVKDGATTRITIGSTALAAGHSVDAAGTDLTDAAWPGSNAGVSITMAGTTLTLNVPVNSPIQHLSVVRTA